MASVNKVIIVGNLGRDPEVRYTPGGDPIANIAVATSYKFKDKSTGEQKEVTEWHRIAFFGRLAEIAGQYLKKGGSVYVEGRLQTHKYTDKDGVERYATDIIAEQMQMLGSVAAAPQTTEQAAGSERPAAATQAAPKSKPTAKRNKGAAAGQSYKPTHRQAPVGEDSAPF